MRWAWLGRAGVSTSHPKQPDRSRRPLPTLGTPLPGCRYLESIAGHQWVAHRIPADSFFVSGECVHAVRLAANCTCQLHTTAPARHNVAAVASHARAWPAHIPTHFLPAFACAPAANQGRLQEADLSDTDNVLASPGLMEFAEEHGLFNSSDDKPFNTVGG